MSPSGPGRGPGHPQTHALPPRTHLPSGLVVRLSREHAEAAAASLPPATSAFDAHRAVLSSPHVLTRDDGTDLDFDALVLRDAHVLCALVARAGLVPEAPSDFTCGNCGAPFSVAPSTLLEVGPFVDGELDDPELDAPFAFDRPHAIAALRLGGRSVREICLRERTVGEALALLRLDPVAPLRITPALVAAMGISAIGRERRATVLADAVACAPDHVFRDIVDLLHDAHYPPRLVGLHLCAGCGARNDLDVPVDRALARIELEGDAAKGKAFPDLDAFEGHVRAIAERVYAERGVRNIGLFIDAGDPACDDGGEPLLGCYTPGTSVDDFGMAEAPEIRLFYRTFQAEARADDTFDVLDEIRETLDHEIEHHLNHMAGDDPLDDEERDAIVLERAKRVGRREEARRAKRGITAHLKRSWRATWPVWLVLLLGAAIAWWADHAP